jgi:hypothetical protein
MLHAKLFAHTLGKFHSFGIWSRLGASVFFISPLFWNPSALGAPKVDWDPPASTVTSSSLNQEIPSFSQLFAQVSAEVGAKKPKTDMVPQTKDLYYKCITTPVAQSLLCVFNVRYLMSAALARASYFYEVEPKVLVGEEALREVQNSKALGYNLPSSVAIQFKQLALPQAEAPQESRTFKTLRDTENLFWERTLSPFLAEHPQGYLISIAYDDVDLWPEATHEIWHAVWNENSKMREALVGAFWQNRVSETDRKAILETLKPYYNTNLTSIVLDEFHAYMLMVNASTHLLGPWVPKYAAALKELVTPITSQEVFQLAHEAPLLAQNTPSKTPKTRWLTGHHKHVSPGTSPMARKEAMREIFPRKPEPRWSNRWTLWPQRVGGMQFK